MRFWQPIGWPSPCQRPLRQSSLDLDALYVCVSHNVHRDKPSDDAYPSTNYSDESPPPTTARSRVTVGADHSLKSRGTDLVLLTVGAQRRAASDENT